MIAFTFLDDKSIKGRHPESKLYEDIGPIVAGTPRTLTPSNARKCVGALIKWEGTNFRVRMDGGNPVGTGTISTVSGYLRQDGDEYFCSRDEAMKLVCVIDEISGGVSGFMRVTYYG